MAEAKTDQETFAYMLACAGIDLHKVDVLLAKNAFTFAVGPGIAGSASGSVLVFFTDDGKLDGFHFDD